MKYAAIILGMGPANERRRYIIMVHLIGWTHHQNYPWICKCLYCVIGVTLYGLVKSYWLIHVIYSPTSVRVDSPARGQSNNRNVLVITHQMYLKSYSKTIFTYPRDQWVDLTSTRPDTDQRHQQQNTNTTWQLVSKVQFLSLEQVLDAKSVDAVWGYMCLDK